MRIKRFTGPDLPAVAAQIKDEFGPDAVVLSQRAAVDEATGAPLVEVTAGARDEDVPDPGRARSPKASAARGSGGGPAGPGAKAASAKASAVKSADSDDLGDPGPPALGSWVDDPGAAPPSAQDSPFAAALDDESARSLASVASLDSSSSASSSSSGGVFSGGGASAKTSPRPAGGVSVSRQAGPQARPGGEGPTKISVRSRELKPVPADEAGTGPAGAGVVRLRTHDFEPFAPAAPVPRGRQPSAGAAGPSSGPAGPASGRAGSASGSAPAKEGRAGASSSGASSAAPSPPGASSAARPPKAPAPAAGPERAGGPVSGDDDAGEVAPGRARGKKSAGAGQAYGAAAYRRVQSSPPAAAGEFGLEMEVARLREFMGEQVGELRTLFLDLAHRQNLLEKWRERPDVVGLYRRLLDTGLSPGWARDFTEKSAEARDAWGGELSDHLRKTLRPRLRCLSGEQALPRLVAVTGPSGSGKTTSLVRLAVHCQKKGRRVSVITLDTLKLGAVEQLSQYARILGLGLRACQNKTEFLETIDLFQGSDLILVDTNTRDFAGRRAGDDLSAALLEAGAKRLLVLPAGLKIEDLEALYERLAGPTLLGLVLTKLDETRGLGNVMGFLAGLGPPLAFFCTGPRTPEDFLPADAERLLDYWLGAPPPGHSGGII